MRGTVQPALLCSLVLIFTMSFGCSSEPEMKPPKEKVKVSFITNAASDFWKVAQKGCEKADAEDPNVDVNFQTAFGGTAVEQDRYINEALARGADAIAISPVDPVAAKKAINNAAKSIPIITQDSDAPESNRTLYLGADNHAAGKQAGELMKQALPQGGKIMVFVGKKEALNAQERFAGVKEALAGSNVEVLDLMVDNNDHVQAKDNAIEAMQKHPDLAGMIGLWSYNGPAIIGAVRNAKKTGKIKIVAFDEEQETLDGIKSGEVFASVAQQPFEYGYQAVQVMAKLARGDKSVIPESKKILVPPIILQRNNVDDFQNKMNQMLSGK